MRLSKAYVKSDSKKRGPAPEPEPNDPADIFMTKLRQCFDGATQGIRDRVSGRIHEKIAALSERRADGLSDVYYIAASDRLRALRREIDNGGVKGLLASGRAFFHGELRGPV